MTVIRQCDGRKDIVEHKGQHYIATRWEDGTMHFWAVVPPSLMSEIRRKRRAAQQPVYGAGTQSIYEEMLRNAQTWAGPAFDWDEELRRAQRQQKDAMDELIRAMGMKQASQPPPHQPPPDAEKYAKDFIEWQRRRNKK